MGWPSSPVNGQTAVVNGITYTYDSARTAWIRSSSTTFNLFTASNIAPTTPSLGDQWYYIATDVLYEYISDGTSNYWVDTDSLGQVGNISNIIDSTLHGNIVLGVDTRYSIGASTGYLRNLFANAITANAITVNGNILPSSNVAYDIGSPTQRFRDLWLSGNTINLGNANISVDTTGSSVNFGNANTLNIAGTTFSANGNIFTITNPGGGVFQLTGNSFSGIQTSTFGNVVVSSNLTAGNVIVSSIISGSAGNLVTTSNISATGNVTGNFVNDSKGELRQIPVNPQTTAYTLIATDAGKFIRTIASVLVPASIFNVGDSVSIYNNSNSSISLIQNAGVTMYNVGTITTGNRTLAQRGLATVVCVDTNTFIVTGGGLT
jgi:hypothetical protein